MSQKKKTERFQYDVVILVTVLCIVVSWPGCCCFVPFAAVVQVAEWRDGFRNETPLFPEMIGLVVQTAVWLFQSSPPFENVQFQSVSFSKKQQLCANKRPTQQNIWLISQNPPSAKLLTRSWWSSNCPASLVLPVNCLPGWPPFWSAVVKNGSQSGYYSGKGEETGLRVIELTSVKGRPE